MVPEYLLHRYKRKDEIKARYSRPTSLELSYGGLFGTGGYRSRYRVGYDVPAGFEIVYFCVNAMTAEELTCNICGKPMKYRIMKAFGDELEVPYCPSCSGSKED